MQLDNLIVKQSADARSILFWIDSLKYEMANCKAENENDRLLKQSLESKLQTMQADAFAVANHFADVEAALSDPLILQDVLEELKA